MVEKLHWLGHSAFRWDGSKTLYFDPYKLSKDARKSDIIFVSHDHFDHMSKPDLARASGPETVIVTSGACAKELMPAEVGAGKVIAMRPGDSMELDGVSIRAVPSYNLNKPFHKKADKKLGFAVDIDGVSLYHAGDTDLIPEMGGLDVDIAMLPVGGTYTMTADEAAEAAVMCRAKTAVPMHYGTEVGTIDDAKRFEEILRGKVEVKILRKEG